MTEYLAYPYQPYCFYNIFCALPLHSQADNYICIYNEKIASFIFYYIIPKDTEKINIQAKLNDGVSIIDLGIGFTLEVIGNIFDTKELLEEDG